MKITVFSDCHWHSPTPINIEPELGFDVFYIGDNHEFKNIPREKINEYRDQYLKFLNKCATTGTKILNGNHEVNIGYKYNNIEVLYTKDKSTALVHFHRESWSENMVRKWHTKKAGVSKVMIAFIKIKNLITNKMGATKLKNKQIVLCHMIAKKYNVKNIVFGHTHPKHLIIEKHDGITMINVPRGKTILYCDTLGCSDEKKNI